MSPGTLPGLFAMRLLEPKEYKLVHVYHGDGKGKTTAAMGLALRARAAGRGVLICQFLKDGTSGEVRMLGQLDGVTVMHDTPPVKFSFCMNEEERAASRAEHDEHLLACIAAMRDGAAQLVVLDEVLDALSAGLLDEALMGECVRLAAAKPDGPELVLTGRNPPAFVLDAADYVTLMSAEKHPYQHGIAAREGIEF